jgi:hypothetical protein
MKSERRVARMEDIRNVLYTILDGYRKGRDHLGDLDIDGNIILQLNLKKYNIRVWIGLMCFCFICGLFNDAVRDSD